ncbi:MULTISPECIES: TlpA family protein disulfide reductase [unclassified Pseudactinotalea]|uniref:TlpA family protein disulfide reductase n=1 Tax=Micrococcales TaxID=85006 RepID=UPI003C7B7253
MVLALVAGCTSADGGSGDAASDVAGAGYVAGDGSVETWAAADRGAAVDLSGVSYDSEDIDLADLRGQVVVVNFWYANCPPCRKEAPDLAELSEQYEPDGVRFLGVNHIDAPGTAQAFERRFAIPYPSLHDSESAGVAAMQGVVPLRAMPTTVVLDREGRVAARILGLAERSVLSTLIAETLEE